MRDFFVYFLSPDMFRSETTDNCKSVPHPRSTQAHYADQKFSGDSNGSTVYCDTIRARRQVRSAGEAGLADDDAHWSATMTIPHYVNEDQSDMKSGQIWRS
jgi:hypothetical protein